jgi:hypothetical protein
MIRLDVYVAYMGEILTKYLSKVSKEKVPVMPRSLLK